MFRKSIPTRLFTTNSILFNCTKLQPIVISRTFIQHVNKNNFSNKLMSPQIQLIDKKYFSNKIGKQEIIVSERQCLSTQNNNHDNKNVDYYMDKYNMLQNMSFVGCGLLKLLSIILLCSCVFLLGVLVIASSICIFFETILKGLEVFHSIFSKY